MNEKHIKIAVDAMGGELAPGSILQAINIILEEQKDVTFLLYGDKLLIVEYLEKNLPDLLQDNRISIEHVKEQIHDDDPPKTALKKESSMKYAIKAVQSKKADAVISSGSTAGLMLLGRSILGMIETIDRPAIAAIFPGYIHPSIVLDCGANMDCSHAHLYDFALMGLCFAKIEFDKENPLVALLNVGSEELKGKESYRKAYRLLKESNINFYGNIEGHNFYESDVDVVVTEGFSGNIGLKVAEGTVSLFSKYLQESFTSSLWGKIIGFFSRSLLSSTLKRNLDTRHYNGALLSGLDGIVIKSHGAADAISFAHAIRRTIDLVRKDINKAIKTELEKMCSVRQDSIISKLKRTLHL